MQTFLKNLWKKIVKYRSREFLKIGNLYFTFYTFQSKRYDLGITFDHDGTPLLSINVIFLHLEIEYDSYEN